MPLHDDDELLRPEERSSRARAVQAGRECIVGGCYEAARRHRLFCDTHWKRVPEDVRFRLRWAVREGDNDDIDAAIIACCDEMIG